MPDATTIPDFWQFIASMGVGGVLAAYAFYISNKNQKDHTEVVKGYHELERGRTDMLVKTITDVSSNITKNTVVTEALHRRLDRDEYDRQNGVK